jgi:hypothetical protein
LFVIGDFFLEFYFSFSTSHVAVTKVNTSKKGRKAKADDGADHLPHTPSSQSQPKTSKSRRTSSNKAHGGSGGKRPSAQDINHDQVSTEHLDSMINKMAGRHGMGWRWMGLPNIWFGLDCFSFFCVVVIVIIVVCLFIIKRRSRPQRRTPHAQRK